MEEGKHAILSLAFKIFTGFAICSSSTCFISHIYAHFLAWRFLLWMALIPRWKNLNTELSPQYKIPDLNSGKMFFCSVESLALTVKIKKQIYMP